MQTKKNHRLSVKGFTLVEMVVVLAIVGVLMAVIAPNLSSSIRDKKTVSACVNAEQVLMGVQNWLTEMEVQGVEVGDYTTRPDITTTKKFLMVQGFGTGYYQIVDYGTPEPEECSLSTTLSMEQRDLKKFLPRSKDNDTADFDKSWVASINLETYTVEYVCWKAEGSPISDADLTPRHKTSATVEVGLNNASLETAIKANGIPLGCYPIKPD